MATSICPQYFTFECTERSCCERYQMNFIMLLFSIGVFLLALLVLGVWLAVEFRPSKRTRNRRDTKIDPQLEEQSKEETTYLRRMSQINPHARHSMTEFM